MYNHTNIVQLHKFKCSKDNLSDGEILISEDFSENYALKQQNEIILGHWSQEQLSLFCITVHFLRDGERVYQHYVLCSDDLGHDKNSVYFYKNKHCFYK